MLFIPLDVTCRVIANSIHKPQNMIDIRGGHNSSRGWGGRLREAISTFFVAVTKPRTCDGAIL